MADQNLGSEFEAFVDELVGSGRYESRDDVLRHSLRLLQGYEATPVSEAQTTGIRVAVDRGIADAEAGRVIDANQAFDELDTYFRRLAAAQR